MTQTQSQMLLKLMSHLQNIFKEDCDDYINLNELAQDDSKFTEFMHVLANLLPTAFYAQITKEDINALQFNHIANQLCFKYLSLIDKP